MLMLQRMQGYGDNWQVENRHKGTVWHYITANRSKCEWQVGPNGLVGPGNEIQCHVRVKLSGVG